MGRRIPFSIVKRGQTKQETEVMKKINQLIVLITLVFLLPGIAVNLFLAKYPFADDEKEYRVYINRVEKAIRDYEDVKGEPPESLEAVARFSGGTYRFVQEIYAFQMESMTTEQQKSFFQGQQEDYVIFATDICCYKIIYAVNRTRKINGSIILAVNLTAGVLYLTCLFLLLYIRRRILEPFHRLSDIPYELSKGNLTVPLKENSDKAFGRFIWGMDLLREKLEENKMRELALQKEKKVLLLSLSHDIKTPLSAIKLYSGALRKNLYKSEEKKLEIVGNINSKADEIEGYIAEIVRASNEDFLAFEVENKEFYVKDAMEQIKEYYADKMKLNQIDFSVGSYSNCLVHGDWDRLVEVLQNVIENAIKYGDGRKISVAALREEETYTISVSNTGCVLPEQELPHIFDSFFRGSNVEKKPGSGLGLYICRKLMHMMEGEIIAGIRQEGGERLMCINIILRLA